MGTTKNILIGVLALAIAWLVREKINSSKYQSRVESNLAAQQQELTAYELKNNQLVSTRKTIEVTNKELKRQIWVKDDSLNLLVKQFKKVKAAVKIEQEVEIRNIPMPYEVPVPYDFTRNLKKINKYYSLFGVSNSLGVTIDSLKIHNTQRIVIGTKRSYFKTTITTDVTNSNPHVNTTGITSQVATTPIHRLGLGFFVGYNLKLEPTFGAGLVYTPFFF
jgi:type II secretory pathway pseudopilin PulG